jgi:hypothetical protein
VGNGKDIKVWGEQWFPTPTTFTVQSHPRILDENAHVAELINAETQCWKADLIRSVFEEEEATAIINIPLSPIQPIQLILPSRITTQLLTPYRSLHHFGRIFGSWILMMGWGYFFGKLHGIFFQLGRD